ncbi:hypothetical protein DAPPUDRAFT_248176 [Daphnia pulex]|uniref:DNA-directed RNA polymerase n=1 Tax=Daphnia pulex TaxID=6669 RepID=E9GTV1_DAPPU|nr:hypothetical protein DAPPUDRAFT_248176 [Daphnia pulex]|eukprot:EFX77139.1 hypothetical protein DAPPUDRAFT_248176 [Daphnia pulex]
MYGFFDRAKTSQMVASVLAGDEDNVVIKLPPPCILKPAALWSGQIFNRIKVNLRTKGKEYSKKNEEFMSTTVSVGL